MKINTKDLHPNPFRDMKNYPIIREKVDQLKSSINETGFWDNVLARKNNGKIEIAYGHHRLMALKELFPKGTVVDIPIKNLPDSIMLKIMANENMEQWSLTPKVIDETIRVTYYYLKAHPEEIQTKEPKHRRVASDGEPTFMYSPFAFQIAEFLGEGWNEKKVYNSIKRLEAMGLIEKKEEKPKQEKPKKEEEKKESTPKTTESSSKKKSTTITSTKKEEEKSKEEDKFKLNKEASDMMPSATAADNFFVEVKKWDLNEKEQLQAAHEIIRTGNYGRNAIETTVTNTKFPPTQKKKKDKKNKKKLEPSFDQFLANLSGDLSKTIGKLEDLHTIMVTHKNDNMGIIVDKLTSVKITSQMKTCGSKIDKIFKLANLK